LLSTSGLGSGASGFMPCLDVNAADAGILQIEYDNGKSKTHTWATGSSMGNGLADANEAGLFQIQ
jgi:hypothetical protein